MLEVLVMVLLNYYVVFTTFKVCQHNLLLPCWINTFKELIAMGFLIKYGIHTTFMKKGFVS
jgi:hypothetical protein